MPRRFHRDPISIFVLGALTAGLVLAGAIAAPARAACGAAEIVVKIRAGRSVDEVIRDYPVRRDEPLLTSRNLFRLLATDPTYCATYEWSDKLADDVEKHSAVLYAESALRTDLSDGRFHAWPEGDPDDAGTDPAAWTGQLAASQLQLAEAHRTTRGAKTVIAVLDTGVDATHPALASRLVPGYDYIGDDPNPDEDTNELDDDGDGVADESYGHGTFASGTVAMVAPDAKIMPMRTLDTDGSGNSFVVAEAVADAVAARVNVINLSFGTPLKPLSGELADAIKKARAAGIVVVASAGNEGSVNENWPAAQSECLAVAAENVDRTALATFSNRGSWVDAAAPGSLVVGPFPEGRYARWNGTSIAAPLVSGQAALVRAARPALSADKIKDAITKSATLTRSPDGTRYASINIPRSLTISV
jgi:subtilisin family serine protease